MKDECLWNHGAKRFMIMPWTIYLRE